jgi:hypothetical protein
MPAKTAYVIIILGFISLACGSTIATVQKTAQSIGRDGQLQVELVEHQQRWAAANVNNYRYTVYQSCIGPDYCFKPHVVEVRDGVVVAITDERSGAPVNNSQGFSTVDDLFAIVQEALWNNHYEVAIAYDQKYGYPIRIWINPQEQVASEEISLDVTAFEVIK